jgi:hypothetical protein
MERYEKIAILDDEVQAEVVDSALSALDIPHIMVCYHDAAFDGLFRASWGHVEAPGHFKDQILTIIGDLKTKSSAAPQTGEG